MSTEASVEGLPQWPPRLRMSEDGSHGIYGDLKFHPSMHLSMLVTRQADLIASLRARLKMACDELRIERSNRIQDQRYMRSAELYEVLKLCEEPSHG